MTDVDHDSSSRFRELHGPTLVITSVLLGLLTSIAAVWALDVNSYLGLEIFLQQYMALIMGLALCATFLLVPGAAKHRTKVPFHDWILVGLAGTATLYVTILYPALSATPTSLAIDRVILSVVTIALILEATRRLVGWSLIVLAVALIFYSKWAYLLPGILYGKGSSWGRIATYALLDANGIFGIALKVTATVVAAYVIFGQALNAIGGGTAFTQLSLALLGRMRGGPAKVAVVSSSLFGMMSGSAVSNVVVCGSLTIPLMKRNGYSPAFAAATEAAASTGGQIMPPVMGVAAFIIAENLGIPYSKVALAAAVPALFYYVALFLQVDLEARRTNLRALSRAEVPSLFAVLRKGWTSFLPLLVLIYTLLVANWSAPRAGMAAVAMTLVIGFIKRPPGFGLRSIVDIALQTGRTMLDIVVISALAGIVIGALQLSGLGFTLSLSMTTVASQSIMLLLIVTAIACLILGMGMPTAVIYVMLAVMVAPALVTAGIHPLAAHLFIFYLGMASMITPPVCMATMAAAAIGNAPFWQTGWTGMRLGIAAFVVPFFFVFHPALLLEGTPASLLVDIPAALLGVSIVAIATAGYLFRPLRFWERGIAALAGACLIAPADSSIWVAVNVAGIVVTALLGVFLYASAKKRPRAAEPPHATVPVEP